MRITITLLCVSLVACATSPRPTKELAAPRLQVPAHLVPQGFEPGDCWYEKPAEVTTQQSTPGGPAVATGETGPQVRCKKVAKGRVAAVDTPRCHTKAGKDLPLSDCCMNTDGSTLPGCIVKPLPPGDP